MTTQPIRNKNQIRQLAEYYLKLGQIRNYVLVTLGLHTALRISDLLRLTWKDVYDFDRKRFRKQIELVEKKTQKPKIIALNGAIIGALTILLDSTSAPGRAIIENNRTKKAFSRDEAYRLIRATCEALGFEYHYSCHSLRKTFGYHAWKNGANETVLTDIFNHSFFEMTKRYLGITQDDRDAVYLDLNLYGKVLVLS